MVAMVRMENGILSRMESSAGVYSGKRGGESIKRPQKLAVMLVPTPPYEICGIAGDLEVCRDGRAAAPGIDQRVGLVAQDRTQLAVEDEL